MKLKKLNTNWNAAPDAAAPEFLLKDGSLKLTFSLDSAAFGHIDKGNRGILEFYEVYMYRSGPVNDEAYFRERFQYTNCQLPSGEFYELKDSDWETNFPADKIIVNDTVDRTDLSHFIFFFNDQLVQCIAGDYKFSYASQPSEKAKEKYPGEFFTHFLGMFTSNFETADYESFEAHVELYLRLEGVDSFIGVLTELRQIEKNNDYDLFLKVVNEWDVEHFGIEQLKDFIWIIQHFGKDE